VKEERSRRLIRLGEEMAARYAASFQGQTLNVLVEGQTQAEGIYQGLADNYLRVAFPADDHAIGAVRPVRIEGATGGALTGIIEK
jgi:threonylcarbamoyladenosine tRNA methylthiotransferase MtaB